MGKKWGKNGEKSGEIGNFFFPWNFGNLLPGRS